MIFKRKSTTVKLFVGLIFNNEEIYSSAKHILENKFGPSDFISKTLPFNHTQYYQEEFGDNLKRKFISFRRGFSPCMLAKIKLATNKIERRFIQNHARRINIDPGILTLSKIILATTKDYSHRIYLSKGIYAEVTLHYKDKSFCPWEWTYPDYKTADYIQIFNQIRDIYHRQSFNR